MKSPIYLFSTSFLYIALDICLYAVSGHATTATLTDAPGYESQRPCAKSCYAMDFYDGPARLAYQIDCAYQSAVENECICRSDMQANAVSYLKDCVSSDCEKGHDVTVALDLYNDYCTGAGFTAETQTPSTTSSSDNESESQSTTEQPPLSEEETPSSSFTRTTSTDTEVEVEPTTTQPGPSASPTEESHNTIISPGGGGGDSGLDAGEIVGIVVGILGFLATSTAVYFQYKTHKRKKAALSASA